MREIRHVTLEIKGIARITSTLIASITTFKMKTRLLTLSIFKVNFQSSSTAIVHITTLVGTIKEKSIRNLEKLEK